MLNYSIRNTMKALIDTYIYIYKYESPPIYKNKSPPFQNTFLSYLLADAIICPIFFFQTIRQVRSSFLFFEDILAFNTLYTFLKSKSGAYKYLKVRRTVDRKVQKTGVL